MMSQVDPLLVDAVVEARPRLARLFAEACQRGVAPRPVGSHRYFLLLDQLEPARLVTYALRADGQLCAATRVQQLEPTIEAEDFSATTQLSGSGLSPADSSPPTRATVCRSWTRSGPT